MSLQIPPDAAPAASAERATAAAAPAVALRTDSLTAARAAAPAPVTAGFTASYALAYFGIFIALITPVVVTLSVKITTIVPAAGVSGAVSLVFGVGALLALVGNPLFGRLSDRTTSRFGRRRPWVVGGFAGGIAGLAVIAAAPNVGVLLAGWCLAQLSFNAALAAIVAVLPDHVAPEQRGTVSGVLGMAAPVSIVAGSFVAQAFSPNLTLMFLVPAVVGAVCVAPLVATLRDVPAERGSVPPLSVKEFFGSFVFDPRKNPDFGWAWVSRFAFFTAFAFVLTYQAVILIQHLGTAPADVAKYIFLATLANTVVTVGASLVAGRLSDRLRRRKVFVLAAALLYAASFVLLIGASTPSDWIVAMGAAGLGYGAYLAADLALVADVLPDSETSAAKDMGVFNIANAAPQSLAPAIAPLFLGIGSATGGNWNALFVAAIAFAVVGALTILPVKAVR